MKQISPLAYLDKRIVQGKDAFRELIPVRNLRELPDNPGVFVFLDKDAFVLYIGETGGSLKDQIQLALNRQDENDKPASGKGAAFVSFYRTNDKAIARLLHNDWITKYDPPNNIREKG